MKSLMTFAGILAFNLSNYSMASDFSCPVSAQRENYTCSGTVKVTTLEQLNSYSNNLGASASNPTVVKNLEINFSPDLTTDLVISSPCTIKIPSNITITSTGSVCLHARKGMDIDNYFKFKGKNLSLEGNEELLMGTFASIEADDIKFTTHGNSNVSKIYLEDSAIVRAANMSMESFDVAFIGRKADVKLSGTLSINSTGANEASIREVSKVEAKKIEVKSVATTRIASDVTLKANEIKLQGATCSIHTTSTITSPDRNGNCFLISMAANGTFSVDKVQGTGPLTVNFSANNIAVAKGYIWTFGDGSTVNTLIPTVSHTYTSTGVFAANLKYALQDNYGSPKTAGTIKIDVKAPATPAIPPRGNLKYQTDGTFVYLRGFIRKTSNDIADAYYVIDDNQHNKFQIPNFYQNSITSVDVETYGRHKVTMYVVDVQGLTYSKSMNIFVDEFEEDVYPYMRLDADQSAPRTIFFDLSWSFNPIAGESLKNFTVDFGDGQTAVLTDTAFITHTYAQAGTYTVSATGQVNGNEDYDEYEIEVTDDNTPIMDPVAGFEYQIHAYAGNVMFTDDRSGTPNGEIISYIWDFGDGTVGYGKNASNFYAPGDYLVTLTVVDVAGLRSSQTQKITIVAEGDDIASMLDCWSDRSKHLGCEVVAFDKFNQITNVKLEWGDGSIENLTTPDLIGTGFSIREHIYQNYGTFDVKLTIETSRGQIKYLNFSQTFNETTTPENIIIANIFCNNSFMTAGCYAFESVSINSPIIKYKFEFEGGDTIENSTGLIYYTYTAPGTYNVKLTIENLLGQVATKITSVNVWWTIPQASLNCTPGYLVAYCNGLGSIDPGDNNLLYEFQTGDGNIITNNTGFINYSYELPGTYTITLKVTNKYGQSSTSQNQVMVFGPAANIDPILKVSCISSRPFRLDCSLAESEDIDDGIMWYGVTFEGNDLEQNYSPYFSHIFPTGGIKTIKASVADYRGKIITKEYSFELVNNILPNVNFECTNNKTNTIDCLSISDPGESFDNLISFKWEMDDGTVYESMVPGQQSHKFSASGTHQIRLTVVDQYGGASTISKQVTVKTNINPVAIARCTEISKEEYDCFGENSHDADGEIVKYEWIINGQIINQKNIRYKFSDGGSKPVKLRVIDDFLGEGIDEVMLSVDLPIASFECLNLKYKINCNMLSNINRLNNIIIDVKYVVDDTFLYSTKDMQHDFLSSGEHKVTLITRDYTGKIETQNKFIAIFPSYQIPRAKFTEVLDVNQVYYFDASESLEQDREVATFKWSFDGVQVETSTSDITHQFNSLGNHSVSLQVVDKSGVSNTTSKNINVYDPEVPFPIDNNLTVEGVDTDNDGVRDDVQRWIAYATIGKPTINHQLKKLTINWANALSQLENTEVQNDLANSRDKIRYCLEGVLGDTELVDDYLGNHAYVMFNTDERLSKFKEARGKTLNKFSQGLTVGANLEEYCD